MEISLFFFSGTGNTWWISKQIADEFKQKGHNVTLFPIESRRLRNNGNLKKIIESSDIIGFGYPVYNSDVAEQMKEFLEKLPDKLSKPINVFSFCTQMFMGGNGGAFIRGLIEKNDNGNKEYKLRWAAHFIMPCNLHLPPYVIVPTKPKIDKILAAEKKYVTRFVDKILKGTPWIEGGFKIVNSMFSLKFPTYKKLLEIDTTKCNECNLCCEICPANNIVAEKGNYHIRNSCYFCTRCYNFCPKFAIKPLLEKVKIDDSNTKRYKGPNSEFNPKLIIDEN
jgi:flavodoxin/ferredoxin